MTARLVHVVTLAGSVAALACGGSVPAPPEATLPASTAAAASVDVVTVVSRPLDVIVPLPAELEPYERVPLFSKVSGFVASIAVDRGSRVRRGQHLLQLEAPELLSQVSEAQARLQSAQAQLAAAQARLAADQVTLRHLTAAAETPGTVAGNDLEMAQKTVEAGQAQVQAQRELVDAAGQAVRSITEVAAYLDVKAPFDGVVVERNVHPGALVGPAGSAGGAVPMLRLESIARLRLVVPVPEAYVAGIEAGTDVAFTSSGYPGRTFTGTVARIAHAVDVATRTMPVELDVDNRGEELAPGGFVQAQWRVRRPEPTLFVPAGSVASTLERTFVVRVRAGTAEWVDVRTGLTTGDLVEVFGALRPGDQVAARGTDELRPGTALQARLMPER